jgi:hypothetical protein
MAASAVPVIKGVKITVREAISDYGLAKRVFKQRTLDRIIENIQGISRL